MADYSSDAPLSTPDGDAFQRWQFAERIAHVIRKREGSGSLVVGLYGAWGEGKTTVLNFVESALSDDEDVVVVRFNPWRFGDEEALIRSFFDVLAEGVDRKLRTKGDVARGMASKVLSVISASMSGTISGLTAAAESLDIDLSKLVPDLSEVSLVTLRDRLSEILREASVRVVVVVDDIDRLDKDEVHAVFRLVKLSADFDGVTYLLAFDPDVVAASLQERYGSARADAGRDFLDKIVTVPLQIPPARPDALLELALNIINDAIRLAKVHVEDDGVFVNGFRNGILPALRTPRAARRYGNALLFALPILAGEVNAADQMLVEGMRVVYPGLYEHVRRHPEWYATNHPSQRTALFGDREDKKKERRERVDAAIQKHAPQNVAAATALIDHLYPSARGDTPHPIGYLRSEQRAASDWHFDRYFTYSLPRDAVSDRVFTETIGVAATQGAEGVAARLRALIGEANRRVVADMIYDVRETVPLDVVREVALGVALAGDAFDEYDAGFLMGLSSENRTTAALEDMVGRLDEGERQTVSEEIVRVTPSISFAINYRGWADPAVAGKGDGILTPEGGQRLVELIAERVRAGAEEAPPHLSAPDSASRMYGLWMMGLGREGVEAYLTDRLQAYPEEAWPLLRSQLPRSQSSARAGTFLGDYSRDGYNWLARYVDPAVLAEAFAKMYDERVLDAGYIEVDYVLDGSGLAKGLSPEEVSVAQFMHVHRRAQAENGGSPPTEPSE